MPRENNSWSNQLQKLAVVHRYVQMDLLEEILSPSFLQRHGDWESISDFVSEIPWPIEHHSSLVDVPESVLDRIARNKTNFDSWDEMWQAGVENWKSKKLEDSNDPNP